MFTSMISNLSQGACIQSFFDHHQQASQHIVAHHHGDGAAYEWGEMEVEYSIVSAGS
jgi:hypothetical protein